MATPEFVAYLNSVLRERRARNAKYSLRAFASALGVHSGGLSAILSGKRALSPKLAAKILDRLKVSESQKLALLGGSLGFQEREKPVYTEIDLERFAVVRDWEHTAILAAIEIEPFLSKTDLARRLKLPKERVARAVARLQQVGLLEQTADGWTSVSPYQATIPEIPSEDVREAHRQFLEKALQSLREDEPAVRDFSGTTITFDAATMPMIRQMIRDFRRQLGEFASKGTSDRVYRLNVQFFPLMETD